MQMSFQGQTWCPSEEGRKEARGKGGKEGGICKGQGFLNFLQSIRTEPSILAWLYLEGK